MLAPYRKCTRSVVGGCFTYNEWNGCLLCHDYLYVCMYVFACILVFTTFEGLNFYPTMNSTPVGTVYACIPIRTFLVLYLECEMNWKKYSEGCQRQHSHLNSNTMKQMQYNTSTLNPLKPINDDCVHGINEKKLYV